MLPIGACDEIRTHIVLIKGQQFYPVELHRHMAGVRGFEPPDTWVKVTGLNRLATPLYLGVRRILRPVPTSEDQCPWSPKTFSKLRTRLIGKWRNHSGSNWNTFLGYCVFSKHVPYQLGLWLRVGLSILTRRPTFDYFGSNEQSPHGAPDGTRTRNIMLGGHTIYHWTTGAYGLSGGTRTPGPVSPGHVRYQLRYTQISYFITFYIYRALERRALRVNSNKVA